MPSGLRKENKRICDAIPYPYSCVHVSEYYGKEVFEANKSESGKRYPPNAWLLCKHGDAIIPDIDKLAQAKCQDWEDEGKINRIKGILKSQANRPLNGRFYGDFKDPVECCQYLLLIGVLSAMPRTAVEKQNAQLNGGATKEKEAPTTLQKPTHLTKLANAPEYIMVLRTIEMLEFFGSEDACVKALKDTLEHLRDSEIKWSKYVQTVREESEALGLDADEVEADLQKKKRQRTEKLAQSLTLNYPKEE